MNLACGIHEMWHLRLLPIYLWKSEMFMNYTVNLLWLLDYRLYRCSTEHDFITGSYMTFNVMLHLLCCM